MMDILDMKPRKFIDFWKLNPDETIVASTVNGSYELDRISSFVWKMCDGQHTVQQIINALVKVCNADDQIELIKQDIIHLLQEWQYNQLIIINYNPLHAFSEYNSNTIYPISTATHNIDILLIAPPSPNPTTGMNLKVQGTFPLGIAYISAVLKNSGFSVEVASLWCSQVNEKSIRNLVERTKPRIIGITAMTDNFLNGVYVASIAKEIDEDIITIFGGPHVTFTDVESLHNHTAIDLIVRNEGEFAMLELANYFIKSIGDLSSIKGITYRDIDNNIVRNRRRPMLKNLDELPMPDRASVDLKNVMIGIQTSRGCPGACIFCVASMMAGGSYRVRSAENVVDELIYLYRRGARRVFFQDDTFTVDIERLYKIISLMKKAGLDIEWNAESRVDIIDEDPHIFEAMKKSGCNTIQFGVEAGSQDTLDNLRKNIKVEQIFRAVKAANSAGIEVVCTMLIGHPYDTLETIQQSYSFAERLIELDAFVLFSIVCPYPGTKIRKKAEHYKLNIHDTSYNDYFVSNAFMDIENLTANQIRALYFDGMKELIYSNLKKDPDRFTAIST